jgi:hypothetical protein
VIKCTTLLTCIETSYYLPHSRNISRSFVRDRFLFKKDYIWLT